MDKKKIIFIALSVLICILVYAPTPKGIDPEEFHPKQPTNIQALQVSKNQLADAVLLTTPAPGPEDVQIDKQGFVYSGLHDGSIIQIKPDNSQIKTIAKTQGAIFGIDLNSKGDKLALADQISGIKLLDLKTGQFENLVSEYEGNKFASPNGIVFGNNDQIVYFSVSSQVVKMSQFHEMLLYGEGSGRIFGYNLKNKQLQLLADHLHFVNGIEYNPKQNCLYFVETSRSRVSKLQLTPEKKGNVTIVIDNILGYPDNVKLTSSGDLWIALPALRDSFSNIIDNNSIIRRVLINLRTPLGLFLALANMKYAGGIKVDAKTGEIKQYFFGHGDKINCISGINQGNGKLYLSSLCQDKIAVVDIPYEYKREQQQNGQINQQIQTQPTVAKTQTDQVKPKAEVQTQTKTQTQTQIPIQVEASQQTAKIQQNKNKVEQKFVEKQVIQTEIKQQQTVKKTQPQMQVIEQTEKYFKQVQKQQEIHIQHQQPQTNIESLNKKQQQVAPSTTTKKPTTSQSTNTKSTQTNTQKQTTTNGAKTGQKNPSQTHANSQTKQTTNKQNSKQQTQTNGQRTQPNNKNGANSNTHTHPNGHGGSGHKTNTHQQHGQHYSKGRNAQNNQL